MFARFWHLDRNDGGQLDTKQEHVNLDKYRDQHKRFNDINHDDHKDHGKDQCVESECNDIGLGMELLYVSVRLLFSQFALLSLPQPK